MQDTYIGLIAGLLFGAGLSYSITSSNIKSRAREIHYSFLEAVRNVYGAETTVYDPDIEEEVIVKRLTDELEVQAGKTV